MYHMKLKGMYVAKIDYSFKEYATMTLGAVVKSAPTVRIRSLEVTSGKSEAIILEDTYDGDSTVIKALEFLGYEKEEVGASYSFTDPTWIKKQDSHYDVDYGGL